MKFFREKPPRTYRNYSKYRQYTRRDFQNVCAHCFRHEDEAGGEAHFVQDHFKPKRLPDVDPADYFNLYWSCVECNGRQNKGNKWPTPEEMERGAKFCDACDHDPVGIDYVEADGGTLSVLTPAGEYTDRHLRLSARTSLVEMRRKRKRILQQYEIVLGSLRRQLASWTKRIESRPSQEAGEKCARLADLIAAYERFVRRAPFMLRDPVPEVPTDLVAGL